MLWMVIGAGPAGIAAVGKLIDGGVPPEKIGWMDPHFRVGDLGGKWGSVSSNTKVQLFHQFLEDCKAFDYRNCSKKFALDQLDPNDTCLLKHIAAPLQWVTDHLKGKVKAIQDLAIELNITGQKWEIKTDNDRFFAKNVILAIGSEPKKLTFPEPDDISLDVALDPDKLAKAVSNQDTIGVFGSSHSAILILANLVDLKVKKIINFYRSPHLYAIYLDDWILFDNTGLKGYAETWAKEHLDGKCPDNLERVLISDHTFDKALGHCDKVIYAVGFERRKLPVLKQFDAPKYNDRTGIIAPGLFGLGIAFPQAQFDKLGNLEHRVGLWKFMDYLNSVLPIWQKYSN